MKYLGFNIVVALIVMITVFIRFYPNHVNLPIGCDEFGYLHLAEAIAENKTFEQHTERSFMPALLSHLNSSGYDYREYAWILTPHAYHIEKSWGTVINQYPPGVSGLISIFPKDLRQFYFPSLIFFLLFLFGFMAIYWRKGETIEGEVLTAFLLLFSVFAITSSPVLKELTSVNSVAPTIPFLLAGGILLSSRPFIAILLIAISINFRLANVLLLPTLTLYYIFKDEVLKVHRIDRYVRKGVYVLLGVFIVGLSIYMQYAQQLIHTAFGSTYSEIDQRSIDAGMLWDNVKYYFNPSSMWFVLNVGLSASMFWLWKKEQVTSALFATMMGMLAIVYAYFITHAAKTPYYPYAPSIVLLGIHFDRLAGWKSWNFKRVLGIKIAGLIVLLIICINSYPKFQRAYDQGKTEETRMLQHCFSPYEVVWGELRTGTIEYATGIPAMRYFWGNEKIRADIMHWLLEHHVKQVIYFDDLEITQEELQQFLTNYELTVEVVLTEKCGMLLSIE